MLSQNHGRQTRCKGQQKKKKNTNPTKRCAYDSSWFITNSPVTPRATPGLVEIEIVWARSPSQAYFHWSIARFIDCSLACQYNRLSSPLVACEVCGRETSKLIFISSSEHLRDTAVLNSPAKCSRKFTWSTSSLSIIILVVVRLVLELRQAEGAIN